MPKSLALLSNGKKKETTAVQDEVMHLADLAPGEPSVGDLSEPPAAKELKRSKNYFKV